MLGDDSFAKIRALAETDPRTQLYFRRQLAETYEEFMSVLYEDIDAIVRKAQERKQIYHDATEDTITMFIVDLLSERGYEAHHDPKQGGHVDIMVRGKDPAFQWLGEAKRDNGPAWLEEGMLQLCRRYTDGTPNRNHGGILVYCQGKFAARILKNWRTALESTERFEELTTSDCPRLPGLAFTSQHIHDTSGLPYTTRHIAVALYHDPVV
ncbi:hypothetical protein ACOTCG_13735 [Achromobacter xylosoxidans]